MGAETSSNSENGGGGGGTTANNETQVVLNVYDLTPLNKYTVWFGFGIFHSGIEVHGMEYGFGAHDFPISGVFEVEPKTCPGFSFKRSISLGHINMPPSEFRTFVETMASEYHGNTYHLISKNCNHFTDDIAWRLTGKHIPGWVNRLARLEEDGTESSSTATHESAESDEDQDKGLLSPSAGNSDVTFIKERSKGDIILPLGN
ncbi:hypothetical protein RHGRI_000665 [Rhododendron griersonianum]|uniref:PPPDE domain-containing protein n=1 Tax=Rhododendron griersonianum TaxID=479676 RepID=A0AAV6LIN0_9ERIC|nr:hypothetical protein RHGRI_000665 [Rhododendron griersonianum]